MAPRFYTSCGVFPFGLSARDAEKADIARVCGPGTALDASGRCAHLACDAGFHLQGDRCVAGVTCGRGTTRILDTCVREEVDGDSPCGEGTTRIGDKCVSTFPVCTAGSQCKEERCEVMPQVQPHLCVLGYK